MEKLEELVQRMEKEDKTGETTISKYVSFSLRETVEKIDAYLNSKFTSGNVDSQGRPKPFFNIVTAASNIWYRATDIDRKNIRIKATRSDQYVTSFLATILLQEWMRKNSFGVFLNEWGRVLAQYGSAVAKFVEKGGELFSEVVPWNRILCDAVDFEHNVKIEKNWVTPAELRKNKNYNKELVDRLCENLVARKTADGQVKDNKADYILLYEVHGELPLSYLTDNEEDDEEYVQQMHIVSFQESTADQDIPNTLFRGREKQDPYFITHLLKEDGRTLAIGAVEHLFEAQWMTNHSVKQIKDQLDLASKLLWQTADVGFVGQNVLTNIENGQILIHKEDKPLTQLSNRPDISAMQAFLQQWQAAANQIVGTPEAMQGQNPPSGTAWRLQQAVLQESHSLFELYTENKGLALEEMIRRFVLPFFKKKLDTSKEISAILEDHQIKQLDAMYVPNEAIRRVNAKIKDTVLKGEIFDPSQQAGMLAQTEQELRQGLSQFANQRFIKPSDIEDVTWKEALKDIEWELEVDITGEARDSQGIITTLTTVFQTIASNPAILNDPNAKLIFNRILNETGAISPIEISTAQSQPAAAQPAPQTGPVGGMPQPAMA